jgi:hypothetical protein
MVLQGYASDFSKKDDSRARVRALTRGWSRANSPTGLDYIICLSAFNVLCLMNKIRDMHTSS